MSDKYLVGAYITGIIVFILVWLYSLSQWGFLVGIMIGWVPALIAGFIGGIIWPVLLIIIAIIALFIFNQH